jgi:hypothetical protein
MLAKYYEDLVIQVYIQWKVIGNDRSDNGDKKAQISVGMGIHSVRIVNRARQLYKGIHTAQEEGEDQEIHGDELHWMNMGSSAGMFLGL